jgi:hypothetical protein
MIRSRRSFDVLNHVFGVIDGTIGSFVRSSGRNLKCERAAKNERLATVGAAYLFSLRRGSSCSVGPHSHPR